MDTRGWTHERQLARKLEAPCPPRSTVGTDLGLRVCGAWWLPLQPRSPCRALHEGDTQVSLTVSVVPRKG